MLDLKKLEETYYIFDQEGRARQPYLAWSDEKLFISEDRTYSKPYFLCREKHGDAEIYSVCRATWSTAKVMAVQIEYLPVYHLQIMSPIPLRLGLNPWEMVFIHLYMADFPDVKRKAQILIMPKVDPNTGASNLGNTRYCRYTDQDAAAG